MSSAVIGNRIYVAGGINLKGSLKTFEVFDADSNAWQELAPLPQKLNHAGMTALNGKIYLSGGMRDLMQKKPSAAFYEYDPGTNQWAELPSMPAPRAAHSMIAFQGKLILLGGLPPNSEECWTYDPFSRNWSQGQLPPLPEARDHLKVLHQGDDLLVVGGRNETGGLPFCLRLKKDSRRWEPFGRLDFPRGGLAAALQQGRIYIAGGEDLETRKTIALAERFEPEMGEWKLSTSLPNGRHGMISEQIGSKWYLIGGADQAKAGTVVSCSRQTLVLDLAELP